MESSNLQQHPLQRFTSPGNRLCDQAKNRLRKWQQVRTWARLIREAESLWHEEERELKRLGAMELSQLLEEVPPEQHRRVNRWLEKYSVETRFELNF